MNQASIYQKLFLLNPSFMVISINSLRVIIWLINGHEENNYTDTEQKRLYNTLGIHPAPMFSQSIQYAKMNAKSYSSVASPFKPRLTIIFLFEQQSSKHHFRGHSVNASLNRKQVMGFVDVFMISSQKQSSQLEDLLMPGLFSFDRP